MCILYKGLKKKCDKWFLRDIEQKKIRETTVVTVVSLMVFASY